jgi:hypothetical protein
MGRFHPCHDIDGAYWLLSLISPLLWFVSYFRCLSCVDIGRGILIADGYRNAKGRSKKVYIQDEQGNDSCNVLKRIRRMQTGTPDQGDTNPGNGRKGRTDIRAHSRMKREDIADSTCMICLTCPGRNGSIMCMGKAHWYYGVARVLLWAS